MPTRPADATLHRLRCEYLDNPLGIDVAQPRLSWALQSARRGARQTAYQVLVASEPALVEQGVGDLWDSGVVASDASTHIAYAGAALRSGQRCWWAARVWDETGQATALSAVAWWEMGLLQPEDWRARWIAGPEPDAGVSLPPCPYLRTTFTLDEPVQRARLYVTARGVYEARLNGRRVGDALLAPGWTEYRQRIQYHTFDVTELVREGENALGAILGDGWYSGYVGYLGERAHYGRFPELLAQLEVVTASGAELRIVSDERWRWSEGAVQWSDLLQGERYDARREPLGWDDAGFDAETWQPVRVFGGVEPGAAPRLVAPRDQPVRVLLERAPETIVERPSGAHIVDFGQNLVGWVRLRVAGPAGTEVTLRHAEILDANGDLYTTNLRSAAQRDTYILRGEGEGGEEYQPHFTFHGFRFVEVSGYPGELTPDALTACVIGSATPPAGTFTCSNELVNQLHQNIVWGQRGNFLSVPTDCPQRDERLGWMGDAQIFVRTATYNAEVGAFFTKWLEDVVDAQFADGAFPDVAPRLVVLNEGAPGWGDAGVIIPWTLFQVYGDTRIIERMWEPMTRWMAYLEEANPTGIWRERRNNDYGDWLAVDQEEREHGVATLTPKDLLATAYYAYDAQLMARMAQAIGRPAEAERYDALFAHIKAAFIAAYVQPDGRLTGETQTAYALAVQMNLLPDELRAAASQHLVANIERRGWRLATGFLGVRELLPALTATGHLDVAYRLLLQEEYPSWGYSIRQGATTIWERWDGWTRERGFQDPGMNSFNHYSLGSVGEWLARVVAGIDLDAEAPDAAGYKRIRIAPQPGGGLTFARATLETLYGEIASAWRREDDGALTVEVTIPPNTQAALALPAAPGAQLFEGGAPVASVSDAPDAGVAGVTLLAREADRVLLRAPAGRYHFTIR